MSKATQRTLKLLRDAKYTLDMVERLIPLVIKGPMRFKRHDMLGFADIVAIREDIGICAVQSTTGGGHTQHRMDMLNNPNAELWLKCGGKLFLISWAKKRDKGLTKAGKPRKRETWVPRCEDMDLPMFERHKAKMKAKNGGD